MRLLNGASPEPGVTLRAAPSTARARSDEDGGKDEEEDEDGGKDGTSRAAPLGVGADPPLAATLAARLADDCQRAAFYAALFAGAGLLIWGTPGLTTCRVL